jgi:phage terminase Nu1 subunit (DNA packaging protein)
VDDMQTPFDTALQVSDLREAAEEYAVHHGEPGTPEYRVAWIRFSQRIRTGDDLRRWRLARAQRSNQRRRLGAPRGRR